MPQERALIICQDNILKGHDVEATYVSTGTSITPGAEPYAETVGRAVQQLNRVILDVVARRYDYVLLPAIDLTWAVDRPAKKHLRSLVRTLLVLARAIRSRPFGRRTVVAVMDRYDTPVLRLELPNAVRADVYFKANLLPVPSSSLPFSVQSLPFWVFAENYPDIAPAKTCDVFYCAQIILNHRRRAREELLTLAQHGVRVDFPQERIPLPQFVERMARSLITLSPSGHGFNGFRHYEAMLVKSVPAVNLYEEPVTTDLANNENCLMYDSTIKGDMARVILNALENRQRLVDWGRSLRSFALQKHTSFEVGGYVLSEMRKIKAARGV
jgi:hypothetical protein